MANKKILTPDPLTKKLSRLKPDDLKLIGISGLEQFDDVLPFADITAARDIIEYHLYDTSDNYIAGGVLPSPLPSKLDVGGLIRTLGFERGTYKIVFNFLRQIGGTDALVFVYKDDRTIYSSTALKWIDTNGKIYAGQKTDGDPGRELLITEHKFWIQEISPSRSEIRLRPNPLIDDDEFFEEFRLLGYTCLSYSDISGDSYVSFDGGNDSKEATIHNFTGQLTARMEGGTLILRDAFIIGYDKSPQEISRYNPTLESYQVPAVKNMVTNGHFDNGDGVKEENGSNAYNEVVVLPNPGHSKWCLKTSPNAGVGGSYTNEYQMDLDVIPGETYIISCWVAWTTNWNGRTDVQFYTRAYNDGGNNPTTTGVADGVAEHKTVGAFTWYRQFKRVTIPEDSTGVLSWYLGYKPQKSGVANSDLIGYRYFTDVQCEAGSPSGNPTPYLITERYEEEDVPTTGLINFVNDTTVSASFSDEDGGFIGEMAEDSDGRGTGKIHIKNAFLIDEVYQQETKLTVLDDIPVNNSQAMQIRDNGYEREFRKSPYHGKMKRSILIQVDNNYTLYREKPDGTLITIGAHTNWTQARRYSLSTFEIGDKLKLDSANTGGPAGILAKIYFDGAVYRTGDAAQDYETDVSEHAPAGYLDEYQATDSPGVWWIYEDSMGPPGSGFGYSFGLAKNNRTWKKHVHNELKDCEWMWDNKSSPKGERIKWEWSPAPLVKDFIWKYPDPALRTDAVYPENWTDGFNSFNWSGNIYYRTNRALWHSGWIGHHAKWVQNEGQFGDTCMKFIDQNSKYEAPNDNTYSGYYGTYYYNTSGNTVTTIKHRWQGISQTMPHAMESQGIKIGDEVTVSWWQKSDTIGKGARVGFYHFKKDDPGGARYWGETLTNTYVEEIDYTINKKQWLQYIPITKVGKWEKASYTGIIGDSFDLHQRHKVYVYGHYGPEGVLWVEGVEVQKTTTSTSIEKTPVYADYVDNITEWVDRETVKVEKGYLAVGDEVGHMDVNDLNVQSYNTFNEFYVDYTSSVYSETPEYGSLRGEIDKILPNAKIQLKNTYTGLGDSSGHDDTNLYDLDGTSEHSKWFIQYPTEKEQNLNKLMNFGQNHLQLITNFKVDQTTFKEYPYSIVYKLYEPLPKVVQEHEYVNIVREMIPPIEETVTLFPFIEEEISDIVLRVPERSNVKSPIGYGGTGWKTYDDLATTDILIRDKIEEEIISGSDSADINIDWSRFSNFSHFGSIKKRVENFKYKLDLIEQYTDRSASLSGTVRGTTIGIQSDPVAGSYLLVSGSSSLNPPFNAISGSLAQVKFYEKKRREVVNKLDNFEKYMFYQSSSYSSESIGISHNNTWPKVGGEGTFISPYVLARSSESIASIWYTDQVISASDYDQNNDNRLRNSLPLFIQEDEQNGVFLNFVDMIGHYYDHIWTFIKGMTDVHDRRESLDEGISRDLLKDVAKSLGWEVWNGKDLVSLTRYRYGMEQTGSESPWPYSKRSERDISREVWSRIINNMPYFLKTKGVARSIKGLITCYGIPSTILRVMEYGGPKITGQLPEYVLQRKFTKAINFLGASNNTYVQNDTWSPVTQGDGYTNRVPDTVEFRFRASSGSNQVLVRRGDDWSIGLKDNNSIDNYGYVSFRLSSSNGVKEITSSAQPVFDNEFYSVMVHRVSASGEWLTSDTGSQDVVYKLFVKKYAESRSTISRESVSSLIVCGSNAISASYNNAWTGSANTITIGGPQDSTHESFSGSMMEYRHWTTPLNEEAFDNHVASPISFNGNHPSASWTDLITRYSFDDDKDLSVSSWFRDVTADQSFTSSAYAYNYSGGYDYSRKVHFSRVVDQNKMKVPNLGPSRKVSNKIRVEKDNLIDPYQPHPVLKFGESIVNPAYDNAPIDSNKLGVYLSPSAIIDDDIISSMPDLDFDQYIGDPRDQYEEYYEGLVNVRNLYWQKYSGPNNFWDYLRLLKYYDNSIYKQITTMIPARANANVGILIEPTIFERDKIIIGKKPTFEPAHFTVQIDTMEYISESALYPVYETDVNYSNPFGHNFVTNETGSVVSVESLQDTIDGELNLTDPFAVNNRTQETGSQTKIPFAYFELWTTHLNYSDPFRVNNTTLESGSSIVVTAKEQEYIATLNINDEFELNHTTKELGAQMTMHGEFQSYSAPSNTYSEIAAGTGSYVMTDILTRPSLVKIGEIDYSGWFGTDYYQASIQEGSPKYIFMESVQPRVQDGVISEFNTEIQYYYSSSVSSSLTLYYSSSRVPSDFDTKYDQHIGSNRAFYLGSTQTINTTVKDAGQRWDNHTAAVEVYLTSPTRLMTTDSPNKPLDVVTNG